MIAFLLQMYNLSLLSSSSFFLGGGGGWGEGGWVRLGVCVQIQSRSINSRQKQQQLSRLSPSADSTITLRQNPSAVAVSSRPSSGPGLWRNRLEADCGSEGMGFDPPLGPKQSEAIFSVHLNRQDCSGGSEYSSINLFAGVSIMSPAAPNMLRCLWA
jgi:hypothetical protein